MTEGATFACKVLSGHFCEAAAFNGKLLQVSPLPTIPQVTLLRDSAYTPHLAVRQLHLGGFGFCEADAYGQVQRFKKARSERLPC